MTPDHLHCGSIDLTNYVDINRVSPILPNETTEMMSYNIMVIEQSSLVNDQVNCKKRKKESKSEFSMFAIGRWSDEEHSAFIKGMKIHGRDWNRIATEYIPSRSSSQVRSHAQKYFTKLAREEQQQKCDADRKNSYQSLPSDFDPSTSTPSISTSMIVQRIINSPESVEQEVEEVLKKLHDRYQQLQQQLLKKKGIIEIKPTNTTHSLVDCVNSTTQNDVTPAKGCNNQKLEENIKNQTDGQDTNLVSSLTHVSRSDIPSQDDELIAVQVLQNGLMISEQLFPDDHCLETANCESDV